jgi:hypothetical protein
MPCFFPALSYFVGLSKESVLFSKSSLNAFYISSVKFEHSSILKELGFLG